MKQHVITEWLLRDFSSGSGRERRLATYSKATDAFGSERADDFMARLDSHSVQVEDRLQRIEGPAARAARNLVSKALALPAGIARVSDRDEPSVESTRDGGTTAGFRVVVAERGAALVSPSQRSALGRFMTLMFTRSPKTERTILRIARMYEQSATRAMRRVGLPADIRAESEQELESVRKDAAIRALGHVSRIGSTIANMHWWAARAGEDERFVLGDTPLAVAIALGHVDVFRPIVGESSFVLAMPLHPEVALLATPLPVLPLSGDHRALVDSINRLSWGWAEQHVVAADRVHLEQVYNQLAPSQRRRVIPVPFDEAALRLRAAADVAEVMAAFDRHTWRPVR